MSNKQSSVDKNIMDANLNDSIVVFDVRGQIFKVRRTLIDSFPDTILARSFRVMEYNFNK
jgi:hypothetical protein